MTKTPKKLIAFAIVLVLSALACTSIYHLASSEDECEAMGGRWVPDFDAGDLGVGECLKPFTGHAAPEETDREPAGEIVSEPADEIISQPDDEIASELVYEIPIEACVAQSDEYAWEFANVNNEGSNDTKEVCQGDFILWNTSNRVLYFKWYEYWDNSAMQDIGWAEVYQRLEPGDEFSIYFGTQTWPGSSLATVTTYTKLIVFYALPDCHEFLVNAENEASWDEFGVPLSDPCR
ncbi:MAG: hypothetical protein JW862_15315 [Anaerolineales bacterium]|nr:hypothetical protein [Anaerolineales bacterium]